MLLAAHQPKERLARIPVDAIGIDLRRFPAIGIIERTISPLLLADEGTELLGLLQQVLGGSGQFVDGQDQQAGRSDQQQGQWWSM